MKTLLLSLLIPCLLVAETLTDTLGRSIEVDILSVHNDSVSVRRADGVEFDIALTKLNQASQQLVHTPPTGSTRRAGRFAQAQRTAGPGFMARCQPLGRPAQPSRLPHRLAARVKDRYAVQLPGLLQKTQPHRRRSPTPPPFMGARAKSTTSLLFLPIKETRSRSISSTIRARPSKQSTKRSSPITNASMPSSSHLANRSVRAVRPAKP